MPKSKGPKTHFEQVPLEVVKKIADEKIPDGQAHEPNVPVDPPSEE